MSALTYTRQLVEHRYGRPLEELRREAAHQGSDDPVLPIVLRRLASLAETGDQTHAVCRDLNEAWQRCRSDDHSFGALAASYATDIVDLERQEQTEAAAVWDLLDVRLLLDRPIARAASARRAGCGPDVEDLMGAARQIAAGLPRLNREALRHGLRTRGFQVSNRRLGLILQRLRIERTDR